jgi:3-methyl-2-oxobutanoate hydroxymethyltransferase
MMNAGQPTALYGGKTGRRVTVRDIAAAKERREKWPMLTAYDAQTARVFDEAGIPVLLVGDSAAMVVYGYDSTIPVTVDDLIPLTAAVVRGSKRAMVVADLPFGSYQTGVADGLATATRFLKETGAHAVKLEGGRRVLPQAEAMVAAGIPVMGHLGLTPQSVHALGGFKVQGKQAGAVDELLADAAALVDAGCFAIVLEAVPDEVGRLITESVPVPTIGIGAGPACDGQVLVFHDLLGLQDRLMPRFVRTYASLRSDAIAAVSEYAGDVRTGRFPTAAESYHLPDEVADMLGPYGSSRTA